MAGITFSKASGVNDSIFGKSQEPIMMFIETKAEAYEQQSSLPLMFTMNKSKHYAEKITGMTSMSGFIPVGEGGAYPKDEMQEGFSKSLEHETFKDQFVITREMVEDGTLMNLNNKPAAFVKGYYRTREQFGAAILAGAIGGASVKFRNKSFNCTGADGKAFFATDHPAKVKGAAQSNKFAGSFTKDNLNKAECAMQNFKDDNGNILGVAPNTIIIPNDASLKDAVFSVIGADKDPSTANNGFNYQFGRWNVVINPYLNQYLATGTTPWILCDSNYNEDVGGAVWLDRTPLDVKSWIDNNNDNNVWNGYARFIAGFNDFRAMCVGGITGATSL